jgi:hypothetical protein
MPVMCIVQPPSRSPSSLFLRIDEVGGSIIAFSHLESKWYPIISLHS